MHEASDGAFDEAAVGSAERATTEIPAAEVGAIEALPLAERAPRYQAVADRLRADLERSDPARGDG